MSMNDKKTGIVAGLALALGLSFSTAAQAGEPEFNARIDNGSSRPLTIAVDCDLLDRNDNITMEFMRQFDVFGHLDNETSMDKAQDHLRLHGVDEDDVNKARQICLDHF